MASTLSRIEILKTWTEVSIVNTVYDIQNTSKLYLEWTYDNSIDDGTVFHPGEILTNLTQTIYIKSKAGNDSVPEVSIIDKGHLGDVQKRSIVDNAGRSNAIGVLGEQWATDVKNDILSNFSSGISNRETKNQITNGSGSISIKESNMLTVSTGTDSDGQASIESYNAIRHRNGHTAITHLEFLFTNPTAEDSEQYIGLIDNEEGYAVGFYNGNFTITTLREGVPTRVSSGFNGSVDLDEIDFTKMQECRITVNTIVAVFEMLKPDTNRFEPIHSIRNQNKKTVSNTLTTYLPIKMFVQNNGNTTDTQIRCSSWQGGVMGLCQTCGNRPFSYPFDPAVPAVKLNIGTTLTPIVAFRSKVTFQGLTNKIRAALNRFHFLPYDGDGLVTIQLIASPTITGTEGVDYNFADIDSDNSVIEVCTDLTAFTGGQSGLTIYSYPTASGSKITGSTEDVDGEALGLFLDPGQVYVIAGQISAGTFDIAWATNHSELH